MPAHEDLKLMCKKDMVIKRNLIKRQAGILCLLGWKLAVAGAETRLIMQTIEQLCTHFGLEKPEIILTRSVIWIEVRNEHMRADAQRRIENFGINMASVSELNLLVLSVLRGEVEDLGELASRINAVKPLHYGTWKLTVIESIASLCFAFLNGGDAAVCIAALLGGFVLMAVRFCMIKKGFFAPFAFIAAAFAGCTTTLLVSKYALFANAQEIKLSIMATTLLLVPGYPYMNGFLDVFKGYLETGFYRLMNSVVLTMAAGIGLFGALWIMGVFAYVR